MAITGKLEADFSPFTREVAKANASLKTFDAANKQTTQAVDALVDSVKGDAVAGQIGKMTTATDQLSTSAEKATTQLKLVKGAADEAAAAAAKVGTGSAEQTDKAAARLAKFQGALMGADEALKTVGVDAPEVSDALDKLGGLADTIGELGRAMTGLAVAGAVVTTATEAWKFGTWFGEVTHLTDAIQSGATHLMGYKTAADDAAAALDDETVAARQADAEAKIAANQAAGNLEARAKAHDELVAESEAARKATQDEVDAFREQGGIETQLIDDINSHAFSLQKLADKYKLSKDALAEFNKEAAIEQKNHDILLKLRTEEARADAQAKANKAAADEKAAKAEQDRLTAVGDQIDKDYQAAEASKKKADEQIDAEAKAAAAVRQTNQALADQAEAAKKAADMLPISSTYDLASAAGMAQFLRLNPTARVSGAATPEYFQTHTLADAVKAGLIAWGGQPTTAVAPWLLGAAAPSTAAAAAATLGQAAEAARGGGVAGHATVINAPVYVSGVFDPQSKDKIGKVVSEALANVVTPLGTIRLG